MNRYQRQRSKEIKDLIRHNKWGDMTYPAARRIWNFAHRVRWCTPCEDCTTNCNGPYNKIAFCPRQR
jgi:hypothetical protein